MTFDEALQIVRGLVGKLDERIFRGGEYVADRSEEDEDDPEDRTNITWTLNLRHHGVITEVLVYA